MQSHKFQEIALDVAAPLWYYLECKVNGFALLAEYRLPPALQSEAFYFVFNDIIRAFSANVKRKHAHALRTSPEARKGPSDRPAVLS